jgi:hypothetical protein
MDSLDDVAKWVAEHDKEGQGVQHLESALNVGQIAGPSARYARTWLENYKNGERRRREAEELELARRQTVAAETSSAAARQAADHAATSARWARLAGWVSIVSLLVAIGVALIK